MKIISYSLFNKRKKDIINGVINCFMAKKIYPDWMCYFYVDETIPNEIRSILDTFDNVKVFDCDSSVPEEQKYMWRFLAASDPEMEVMISRDADSWLSYREKVCVDAFIKSDKRFHIIRDHCYHSQKVMAGVWGIKAGVIPNMEELIRIWNSEPRSCPGVGYDQGFLVHAYERLKDQNSLLIHIANQYNNQGQIANYYNDGGIPMPSSEPTEFENFSFPKVNQINSFMCCHCNKVHGEFIGGIMEHIPEETERFVIDYFNSCSIEYPYELGVGA
jgi:hypothetical protein